MKTDDVNKEKELAKEAMEQVKEEELQEMADERPTTGPNSFWGQKGTWWILAVAFAIVLFLFLWMFFD